MSSFLVILLCLAAGIALRVTRRLPDHSARVLNGFIIYLSFPALTIVQLQGLKAEGQLVYPMAMGWILALLGGALFLAAGAWLRWPKTTTGALIMTGAFSNTSFVGFPLLEAFYGAEAIRTGILVDQFGSFLPLATLGIAAASACTGQSPSLKRSIRQILTFPPFGALVVACVFSQAPLPAALLGALEKIGATLIPLALVSVGLQLNLSAEAFARERIPILLGLAFKLVLGPALLSFLYIGVLGARGRAIEITLLESAMAPMITGAILSAEFGLNTEVANLMVALGIPLSLLTVPIWHLFLARLIG